MKRVKVVEALSDGEMQRKKFGGFNDYPPNWKPCGTDEFWSKFFQYGTGLSEIRQMKKPKSVHAGMFLRSEQVNYDLMTEATLMIYEDDTGLAFVQNRDRNVRAYVSPKLYKFAVCEHLYVDIKSVRRHGIYHRTQQCTKCKDIRELQSSD